MRYVWSVFALVLATSAADAQSSGNPIVTAQLRGVNQVDFISPSPKELRVGAQAIVASSNGGPNKAYAYAHISIADSDLSRECVSALQAAVGTNLVVEIEGEGEAGVGRALFYEGKLSSCRLRTRKAKPIVVD